MAEAEAEARHWLLGIGFTPMDERQAAALVAARDPAAPFAFVSTPNAQHVVALDRGDRRLAEAHRAAWLVLNDSTVLARLDRLLTRRTLLLATGADLTVALLDRHIRPDDPIALIGGTPALLELLGERYGLRDVRWHDPPMGLASDPVAVAACADFIAAARARYAFIAVGAPQGEYVAREAARRAGATGIGLCVGGALNFATGLTRRASPWMRRAGLEALDRLARAPVGHARRVFVHSLPVLSIAAHAYRRGTVTTPQPLPGA